jgi:hypothetical protein
VREVAVAHSERATSPSEGLRRNIPAGVACLTIVLLAVAQGGYFPWTWGWATLALLWVAGTALVLRTEIQLAGLERAFLCGWVLLAGWTALSIMWSRDVSQTVLELERTLVYVGAVWALALVARRESTTRVLAGVLIAVTGVTLFSIATRLVPDRLQIYDRAAVYRLSQPIGYWNGLAVFCTMGIALAAGFAARARHPVARSLAAATVPFLLAAFYFTFGRAAWVALAAALLVAVAVDPRRLQSLVTLVVLAPAAVATIWLAVHSRGLTQSGLGSFQAAHDGHTLALWLALLAAATAGAVAVVAVLERRVTVSVTTARVFAGLVIASCVISLGGVFDRYGSPVVIARKGYSAFKAPPPRVENLNRRLLSFSGNGRYELWRLAWEDSRRHPWLGSGAGSYERYFLQHKPADVGRVRDAHGLYIETLAELGPLGLVLLLVTLALPAVAAVRARREPLVPFALGAYAALLVHALADWDWELPAVTLVAIFCGSTLVLTSRRGRGGRELARAPRVAAAVAIVAVGVFAAIGLVGNNALKASTDARSARDWKRAAAQAQTARTWQPWSPDPWLALGETQLAVGQAANARHSFREAAKVDSHDWEVWYALARASRGAARRRALARAVVLYPRSGLLGSRSSP